MYHSIRPGQVWLDAEGKRIQAHGGSVIFVRRHKHYLITSGTTGYSPNPSEVAVGDSWHGPFTVLGNPHPDDPSHTSFHSQISSVFKVPGKKDLYIACGDRWLPQKMEDKYEEYARLYELIFTERNREEEEEFFRLATRFSGPEPDTSIADGVLKITNNDKNECAG